MLVRSSLQSPEMNSDVLTMAAASSRDIIRVKPNACLRPGMPVRTSGNRQPHGRGFHGVEVLVGDTARVFMTAE